jgi:hypothetical protein
MDDLDFTKGNLWGDALHGHTMKPVRNYGTKISRMWDKIKNRRRYSVMVHTPKNPSAGSKISYKAVRGIVTGTIYKVEWWGDPRDMATVFFTLED